MVLTSGFRFAVQLLSQTLARLLTCYVPIPLLSQGVERPLQPQPRPAGADGQQRQPPHPLQHGVHLLGTVRTPGGRRGAERGGGQPPRGQVSRDRLHWERSTDRTRGEKEKKTGVLLHADTHIQSIGRP